MDERVKVRVQDKNTRIHNFGEVELGYNKDEAIKEASRCLHCQNPRCVTGCPVNIKIPDFIACIKDDKINEAYQIISESSSLPSVCGRVCPQEKQCEHMCIKGVKGEPISIGALERFVADNNTVNIIKTNKRIDKKVAIIGSGPAGLSCAYELSKNGVKATIYEVLHEPGGVLTYGIPEFRLPKKIVEKEIDKLKSLGVNIITDTMIGNGLNILDLKEKYDAVFIASGAGLPKFMGIDGESANQVFSANEILTRINLMKSYEIDSKTPIFKGNVVYVIGGGNVAMDASRSLRRLGIETHLMYRRSEEELPARKVEVEHAKEEGIIFDMLTNPKKIITDKENNVIGMDVIDMVLGEEDKDGRRSVSEKDGSLHRINCDMIVMALGTDQNHEAIKNSNILLNDKNLIEVNGTRTSLDRVYAGGDAVSGSATVILAMQAGKQAASDILSDLNI